MEERLLECPICEDIYDDVVETPCCHKCYCRNCIASWIAKSRTCPECRTPLANHDECIKNLPVQRFVNNLRIPCPFVTFGCQDNITRGIMHEHMEKCNFAVVKCTLTDTCAQFLRKDKQRHETEECPQRPTKCDLCDKRLPLVQLLTHRLNECDGFVVECPLQCGAKFTRRETSEHEEQCPEKQISCPFKKYGCKQTVSRNQMDAHLKSTTEAHLQLAVTSFEEKEKENQMLLQKISALQRDWTTCILSVQNALPYSALNAVPVLLSYHLVSLHSQGLVTLDADLKGATFRGGKNALFSSNPLAKACLVRGNALIPEVGLTYYFEITIENRGKDGAIGIGLAGHKHDMEGMPGWLDGYGYHGDDGLKFHGGLRGQGIAYGPTYTKGDVVGLGWDQKEHRVFFTKNGFAIGPAFENVTGYYYPVIGLHTLDAKVRVNFGQEPFKYVAPK